MARIEYYGSKRNPKQMCRNPRRQVNLVKELILKYYPLEREVWNIPNPSNLDIYYCVGDLVADMILWGFLDAFKKVSGCVFLLYLCV